MGDDDTKSLALDRHSQDRTEGQITSCGCLKARRSNPWDSLRGSSKNKSWESQHGLGWQASPGLGVGTPVGVGDGMTPAAKSLKSDLCGKGTAGQD